MKKLANSELFTKAQRKSIILPLYRQILKEIYLLGHKIDPMASQIIRHITVYEFREQLNIIEISKIKEQIFNAYNFLNKLQNANQKQDVFFYAYAKNSTNVWNY